MKTRIMALLSFDTTTKRDNVAGAISTKVAGYSMFEVILVPSVNELGRPQLVIDLRTNKDIDAQDIFSWAKDQLSQVSNRPIEGSLHIHNCSHDSLPEPCKLMEVVNW